MTRTHLHDDVPMAWQASVQEALQSSEKILAVVELDLDSGLHFNNGILLITDMRILARESSQANWVEWPYHSGLTMTFHDRPSIGYLELSNEKVQLARWCFTRSHNLSARSLMDKFAFQLEQHITGKQIPFVKKHKRTHNKYKLKRHREEVLLLGKPDQRSSTTSTLFRLWRFARPYRNQLILGLIFILAGTAASLVPPYLTMPLMDNVLIPYQTGKVINPQLAVFYISGLLGAAIIAWVFSWARTYIIARISERIGSDLRVETYKHLIGLSQDYFYGKRTGDLLTRIGRESDEICLFLSLHLLNFVNDALMLVMIIPILVYIDPWLALITLLPLPLLFWMILLVRLRLTVGFERISRVWAEVTNVLSDTISGIRIIKVFAQEGREVFRFQAANKRNLMENDKLNKLWSLFSPTSAFITELGLVFVWIFGIWQVAHGKIQVGVLTAFIIYLNRFYGRVESMSQIVSVTQKAASYSRRIFSILDHVSSVPEPTNPKPIGNIKGLIEISNVYFNYGQHEVFHNINLTIKPGEMIGLVGRSGAGKSTLINLICRLYDPLKGTISVDGIDLRSLKMSEYRRNIGWVPQDPHLFFGTIAENLSYGKPEASHAELIEASRAAHAHEFILRLPHGYDTIVGERGQRLSGGECQRIAIARAILVNPRILIFDEATSSLDSQTEYEIQQAIDTLVLGRTTLVIAHRLSTLIRADRILVFDKGQIIEEGNHDFLMAKKGVYYRLHETQARNVNFEFNEDELGEINDLE